MARYSLHYSNTPPSPDTPVPASTNLTSPAASPKSMTLSDHIEGSLEHLESMTMDELFESMQSLKIFAIFDKYHVTSPSLPTPPSHQNEPEFTSQPQTNLVAALSLQGLIQVPLSRRMETSRTQLPKFNDTFSKAFLEKEDRSPPAGTITPYPHK